jgi:hypothetical protein
VGIVGGPLIHGRKVLTGELYNVDQVTDDAGVRELGWTERGKRGEGVVPATKVKPQISPLRSPDFLSGLVALIVFVRFPLQETAYVVVVSIAK